MKKKIVTTALLLFCFFAGFATIENLNGKWTGTLKTNQGDEYPLVYNFKIDGGQLTGTAKTPKGDMPINDGEITGNTFSFNVIVNKMEIDHGMTVHQLACKWLLQQPALTSITGTFLNEHEIREAAESVDKPNLSPAELLQIVEDYAKDFGLGSQAHPCDLKSSADSSGKVRSGYVPPPVLIA